MWRCSRCGEGSSPSDHKCKPKRVAMKEAIEKILANGDTQSGQALDLLYLFSYGHKYLKVRPVSQLGCGHD